MPRKSALAIAGEKIEFLQNETESLKLRIKNYEELEAKHNLQEKLRLCDGLPDPRICSRGNRTEKKDTSVRHGPCNGHFRTGQ